MIIGNIIRFSMSKISKVPVGILIKRKDAKQTKPIIEQKGIKLSNVQINISIMRSDSIKYLGKLISDNVKNFNLINFSTFLKKLGQLNGLTNEDAVIFKSLNEYMRFRELDINQHNIQAICNSVFYMSKLNLSQEIRKQIPLLYNDIENLDIQKIILYSNQKQLNMFLIGYCKMGFKRISNYLSQIFQKIQTFLVTYQIRTWETLLKYDISNQQFNKKFQQLIDSKKNVQFLQDYVYLLYCYSKSKVNITPEQAIKLAKYPKSTFNLTIKDFTMLSYSLGQLKTLKFDQDFYKIIHFKILQFLQVMTFRQLAHIVMAITNLPVIEQSVFKSVQAKFLQLLQGNFSDNQSLFSSFHLLVKSKLYSQILINKMQEVVFNLLKYERNKIKQKDFQKWFHGIRMHGQNKQNYVLRADVKQLMKVYIIQRIERFRPQELYSISYFCQNIYSCQQLCNKFLVEYKKIDKSNLKQEQGIKLKKIIDTKCVMSKHDCSKCLYR